nr:hypothetical protein [uncultured Ruminococcus sp.]
MLVVKPDPKNENSDVKALNAFLDGEPCGYVRFYHKGYILVITELIPMTDPDHLDKDTFAVLDTIIRALGSYGLNHSCFYVECDNPVLYPTLQTVRFAMKDGIMKSDLSKLLNHQHD